MQDILSFHLFALSQGVGVLGALLVWRNNPDGWLKAIYLGLISAVTLIALSAQLVEYNEANVGLAIALLLPAFFALPPLYWLLINYLTSTDFHFSRKQLLLNSLVPGLSLLLSLSITLLPSDRIAFLFGESDGPLHWWENALLLMVFALFVAWLGFSLAYLTKIIRRLINYRRQLLAVFSNTEGRELRWINWHGALILLLWVLIASGYLGVFLPLQTLTMVMGATASLVFILVLTLWGIQQQPGFALFKAQQQQLQAVLGGDESTPDESGNPTSYQNSGLTQADLQLFAEKLRACMQQQVYLAPDLTLPELACKSHIPAIYVSQTLSQEFNCNFYQFINAHRIEYAQQLLTKTDNRVLDIALAAGFNTRSAFYNAFKKQTGMTPGQYRSDKVD